MSGRFPILLIFGGRLLTPKGFDLPPKIQFLDLSVTLRHSSIFDVPITIIWCSFSRKPQSLSCKVPWSQDEMARRRIEDDERRPRHRFGRTVHLCECTSVRNEFFLCVLLQEETHTLHKILFLPMYLAYSSFVSFSFKSRLILEDLRPPSSTSTRMCLF